MNDLFICRGQSGSHSWPTLCWDSCIRVEIQVNRNTTFKRIPRPFLQKSIVTSLHHRHFSAPPYGCARDRASPKHVDSAPPRPPAERIKHRPLNISQAYYGSWANPKSRRRLWSSGLMMFHFHQCKVSTLDHCVSQSPNLGRSWQTILLKRVQLLGCPALRQVSYW